MLITDVQHSYLVPLSDKSDGLFILERGYHAEDSDKQFVVRSDGVDLFGPASKESCVAFMDKVIHAYAKGADICEIDTETLRCRIIRRKQQHDI